MNSTATEILICPTCREPEQFHHTSIGYECPVCGETMIDAEPQR